MKSNISVAGICLLVSLSLSLIVVKCLANTSTNCYNYTVGCLGVCTFKSVISTAHCKRLCFDPDEIGCCSYTNSQYTYEKKKADGTKGTPRI